MERIEELLAMYKQMLRIRMVENKIADKYSEREMHTPIHLYTGEEAVAVGVCSCLDKEDLVFSNHRNHGHYLAKGGDLRNLICELYNKSNGCSSGKGGSMHVTDINVGFPVSSAIVAGQIPIATGAALAFQVKKKKNIVVAFLGDGATEEGVVYESICFAKLKKLPILFVCENNQYAVCSSFSCREPYDSVSDKFKTIIDTEIIDGNNVIEVQSKTRKSIEQIKASNGPVFLECKTYRTRHHHNVTDGVELKYRTREELDIWKAKDPISIYEKMLCSENIINAEISEKIIRDIKDEIEEAFTFARKSSLPDKTELLEGLWG